MVAERVRRRSRDARAAPAAEPPPERDRRARVVALLVEAQRQLRADRPAAAERACHALLTLVPEHADALNLLSVALGRQGRAAAGERASRSALAERPRDPGYLVNLGNRLKEQGRASEALDAYRKAHAVAPALPLVVRALLRELDDHGLGDQAVEVARTAVRQVNDPPTLARCARVLAVQGDARTAAGLLRRALSERPDEVDWWLELARLALKLGDLDGAEPALARVLEHRPEHPEARVMQAAVLFRRQDYERMPEVLHGLSAQGIDAGNAANLTGMRDVAQGRLEEGLAAMALVEDLAPQSAALQMTRIMHLNYDPTITPQALFEAHHAFGARFAGATAPVTLRHTSACDPERRLRIGYLSPDLRGHSVAYFMWPILQAFDRERFEVVGYAHVQKPDAVTAQLRALASDWHDVTQLDDRHLAERIRDDRVDILVELAGYTSDSRLLACTARPAPIQVSYLGYPNTTGLPQIDYRITDHVADPEDADEHYTETLIRLPRCFLCFGIPDGAPPVAVPPLERNGYVTFGSFNNIAKLNRPLIQLWARVLQAVPNSRLLLKSHATGRARTQDHLRDLFAQAGVEQDQIVFAPYAATTREHLELYNEVDVALDSFPYNGTTTTCEALWMGVPVLTLAGDRHAARVGASLLGAVGFHAGIAHSADELVATAQLLTERPELLACARRHLRADLQRSPLCDQTAHARALEEAYRAVWHLWCAERT